jgi:hypothetical protein
MEAHLSEKRNTCRILVLKTKGRGRLGRYRRRWENSMELGF